MYALLASFLADHT